MAHVKITNGDAAGTLRIEVDGADLTNHVYTEGFGLVRVGGDDEFGEWGVSMILAADVLDVELPEAVVVAARKSEGEGDK